MTDIRPEICHDFVPLTRDYVASAYATGTTVTGFVERILPEQKVLVVKLGDGIMGILPFTEVTMYPLRYSRRNTSNIPTNIRCLMSKKIRVKITKISGSEIILSRKQNMLEAYDTLLNTKTTSMYITEVIEKSALRNPASSE